ncbi:MAG: DUF1573 domain-containing protein [Bacteroidia bacterium]|nr:DUF1573 domain-containing protein [Bacteroidia bacterium]
MKTVSFIRIAAVALITLAAACAPKGNGEITPALVDNDATASNHAPSGDKPKMKFDKEVHDFGTITQGDRVKCVFKFTNVGGSDLIISSANGSCGCTVPDYPKKPITPGQDGVINVEFNSEGKKGEVSKTVTLVTNCEPNTTVLTIKANILAPAAPAPAKP